MKNYQLSYFLIFSLFFFACTKTKENNVTISANSEISTSDDLVVAEKCAIILNPNDDEIVKMKEEHGEDGWAEIASDLGYYNGTAKMHLEEKGIKVISTVEDKIVFVRNNGKKIIMDTKDLQNDLIFFTPDRTPLTTYTADYAKDLSYFGIKETIEEEGESFVEGYWVTDKAIDNMDENHVFEYFYKTSSVNDELLLQIFDRGDIKEEEILSQAEEGVYEHPKKNISFTFKGNKITMTEAGTVKGLIKVSADRISER